MRNPIQNYAWGSDTALAKMQGRPAPSLKPEAELWMGAHHKASSYVDRAGASQELREVIAADPARELGPVAAEFGSELPFLLKVIAARLPLSIQVHPDAAQAAAGFAAEETSGIPRGDAKRNYADPYHKPELLCAITEFEAFCGFRPLFEASQLLRELAGAGAPVSTYADEVERIGSLEPVITALLTAPDPHSLLDQVLAACRALVEAGSPHADIFARTLAIADQFPGDVGAIVVLLLKFMRLAPGEAIFIPAGVLHSYVSGVGIEILANSDNVLRAGLTPKHVDVAELLRITDWDALPVSPVPPREISAGLLRWSPQVADFSLTKVDLAGEVTLPHAGPRIIFCTIGEVNARDAVSGVQLEPGFSAFSPASAGPIVLTGHGTIFVAAPGGTSTN